MSTVYLHLGSNINERMFHIARAVQMIESEIGPIQKSSAYYETEAWGHTNQDAFINIAIEVEYYGTPSKLLTITQGIEQKLGREKTIHWGPRIIDIDIIMYDDIVMQTDDLTIPHAMIKERNFVLFPMAEIAPSLEHPVHKKTMQELLDDCTDEGYVTIINPNIA